MYTRDNSLSYRTGILFCILLLLLLLLYTALLFIFYLLHTYLIRVALPALLSPVIRIHAKQHGISWLVAFIFLRSRPDCFYSAGFQNCVQLCKYRGIFFFFYINIKINDDFQLNEMYSLNTLCTI